ncbi:MAG: DUF1989 domain-containing protein [Paracoccus sp. (in: a-proteobacteria)]|uniref:urea carboxylase-associated family protein n=1 Tax=Paracoccus sp. TaxID=267 RepID=UPI0026DED598|nr:DUF1989 domain-containing protein [Paracoccus sp. (in: a-proteobacteria)]MDO5621532.1 DUF1989 domain-containing protein [Paracoccus sp. (in: a-proteobacteria)]
MSSAVTRIPADAAARRASRVVLTYDPATLPPPDLPILDVARQAAEKTAEIVVPAREGRCFDVPQGSFFRITCIDGPQVGDLNLWSAADPAEHFFSGKTRAIHGTHVTVGDRLWSRLPWLRPMATITADTLRWYGRDGDGGAVHDVIGTRCDPYTHRLLSGGDYHHCCHSNLTNALAAHLGLPVQDAEPLVHDVLNVFMLTGFTGPRMRYFMKASPVRPGDYIEFYAEIDLIGGLSACPGGDCGDQHSSDAASCHPLLVEIFAPPAPPRAAPEPSSYRWP